MKPCFIDLHIHTSENANNLNKNYDVDLLLSQVKKQSGDNEFLISFTDHNAINKDAYLEIDRRNVNYIVGVELTIRNYDYCKPYHCHFYFDIEKQELSQKIDILNDILNKLYPEKMPDINSTIPKIQDIVDSFDGFDFLVLPHGGQSHSTFNESIPQDGTKFDTTIMKSLYYNVFDGFTARSDKRLEKTLKYFKKLQINEIINLITCTDNYNPAIYPNSKNNDTDYVKTWMYSSPTFSGLRIALSESSRLSYGDAPNDEYQHLIRGVSLNNDKICIDVKLSGGLNVVIGSSSSGKTLFVDSLYNKITNKKSENYLDFGVDNINIDNPLNISPNYFPQNYILKEILGLIKNNKNCSEIDNITLLSDVFKFDSKKQQTIANSLSSLTISLTNLFNSAKAMKADEENIKKVPSLVNLIVFSGLPLNPYSIFLPDSVTQRSIGYSKEEYQDDLKSINELEKHLSSKAFMPSLDKEFEVIRSKVLISKRKNDIEYNIRLLISRNKDELENENSVLSSKTKKAISDKSTLIENLTDYVENYKLFYDSLCSIKTFSLTQESDEVVSSGHKLSIVNKLEITPNIVVEKFKTYFGEKKVKVIDDITPSLLTVDSLLAQHKSKGIDKVRDLLIDDFKKENRIIYKILYKGKEDFFKLSPGLQASVILDIILGYDKDNAPLIIDQPEDNLSINYINGELIKKIKETKTRKQIIIVSHNATIPMLGDAQTIVLCTNENGKITISSHLLEDFYQNKSMTDWIADLTDGGKKSIKKRFKKYNIKQFMETE